MRPLPEPAARAVVFRALADGRVHTLRDLAAAASTDDDAVARLVDDLKALGMPLQAVPGGVRSAPFVPLDRASIERHLGDASWQVDIAFETRSTNSDLLHAVRTTATHRRPRLVAAEVQRAGRGRLGRPWISPPGASLAASFGLRVERALGDLDGVTLVCGLAVRQALADVGTAARLKWPNDLVVDGRKLAGILVEAHAEAGATLLVVGIGINVASAPTSAPRSFAPAALQPAHLRAAGAAPLDRNRLAARLGLALDEHVRAFARSGFATFAARWNEHDAFRGRAVAVGGAAGIARGVDAGGALLLEVDGVLQRVIAGDVSLRETMPAECVNALLVDIGNSRIKWRFAEAGAAGTRRARADAGDDGAVAVDDLPTLATRWASSAARAVAALFVSNVADARVAAAVSDVARGVWPDADVHRVVPQPAQCGVVNGYRDPSQLGPDRWLALLGAHAAWPGRHLLIASFGTATTIDLLVHDDEPSGQATFTGGMILPGIDAMRTVLASSTARLPLARGTPADFAATTDDAIASGIVAAQAGAVERALARAAHQIGSRSSRRPTTCVIAGGGAATIRPFLDAALDVEFAPDLVLRGLAEVADDAFARAVTSPVGSPLEAPSCARCS